MRTPRTTLVLGGARSGKSRYAEELAAAHPGPKVYMASAVAGDAEMALRIAHHQARRGEGWATVETPLAVIEAIARNDVEDRFVLFDCVTLWVSNLMYAERDVGREVERLAELMANFRGRLAIVSNEVGLGIVPDNPLARAFRDEAGRANQKLASAAEEVVFIAAGLPLRLK